LSPWIGWCQQRKLPKPHFRLRSMPKRWGSALRSGTIYLNPELIKAPSACIDYVITPEICHLKHPDHGPKFRALLQQLCPDWKRLKERLEGRV
jgi:predicted metal-dependent hydrolase